MNNATKLQAFVDYYSRMVSIYFLNKLVNWRFRVGQIAERHQLLTHYLLRHLRIDAVAIGERRQLLTHYLLLREVRKAQLRLLRYGFKRGEVDTPEFPLFIKKCRKDTLAYIRYRRKEERAARRETQ